MKQRFNIYTIMLLLSLLAIITACVLLVMELDLYGRFPQWKVSAVTAETLTAMHTASMWPWTTV